MSIPFAEIAMPKKKDGLWEPEFEVGANGALVMFWSDDPSNTGKKIETARGEYFEHAPTNHWAASRWNDGAFYLR